MLLTPVAAYAAPVAQDTPPAIALGMGDLDNFNVNQDKIWFSGLMGATKNQNMMPSYQGDTRYFWEILNPTQTNMGTKGAFLFAHMANSSDPFPTIFGSTPHYQSSDLKRVISMIYNSNLGPTEREAAAIISTSLSDPEYRIRQYLDTSISYESKAAENVLINDFYFPLSVQEFETYNPLLFPGYVSYTRSISPGITEGTIGDDSTLVNDGNYVYSLQYDLADPTSFRPVTGASDAPAGKFNPTIAMNLDTSKILFTVDVKNESHKNWSDATAITSNASREWKFTLKGEGDFATDTSATAESSTDPLTAVELEEGYTQGTELAITHPSAQDLGYSIITAALVNRAGDIVHYGWINNSATATTSTLTIPEGLSTGSYELMLQAETWSQEYFTDYASKTSFKLPVRVGSALQVTFNLNGGDGEAPAAQTLVANETATEPQAPSRAGHRFLGWATAPEATTDLYDFATPVTNDLALHAQWEELPQQEDPRQDPPGTQPDDPTTEPTGEDPAKQDPPAQEDPAKENQPGGSQLPKTGNTQQEAPATQKADKRVLPAKTEHKGGLLPQTSDLTTFAPAMATATASAAMFASWLHIRRKR